MLPPSPPWPEVNSKAYDSHYGQAHGKERERKKRKKKAHNNAHTASQAMDVLPLGNAGASARCTSLPDVDGGAPAATPYTPRHALHISKNGHPNSPARAQPEQHGHQHNLLTIYLWACVHCDTRGSRNGLAHALQNSIVGSVSACIPQLPRTAARLSCRALLA